MKKNEATFQPDQYVLTIRAIGEMLEATNNHLMAIAWHLNYMTQDDPTGIFEGLRGCVIEPAKQEVPEDTTDYLEILNGKYLIRAPEVGVSDAESTELLATHLKGEGLIPGTEHLVFAFNKYFYETLVSIYRYVTHYTTIQDAMMVGDVIGFAYDESSHLSAEDQFARHLWNYIKGFAGNLAFVEISNEPPVLAMHDFVPEWYEGDEVAFADYFLESLSVGEMLFLFQHKFSGKPLPESYENQLEGVKVWDISWLDLRMRQKLAQYICNPEFNVSDPIIDPLVGWHQAEMERLQIIYQQLRIECSQILKVVAKKFSPFLEIQDEQLQPNMLSELYKEYGLRWEHTEFDFWCAVLISIDDVSQALKFAIDGNYEIASLLLAKLKEQNIHNPSMQRLLELTDQEEIMPAIISRIQAFIDENSKQPTLNSK